MWTVQAPHIPMPQPNLVPFMSRVSLNTQRRGISAGASTVGGFPLSLKVYFIAISGGWDASDSIEYADDRLSAREYIIPVAPITETRMADQQLEEAPRFACGCAAHDTDDRKAIAVDPDAKTLNLHRL